MWHLTIEVISLRRAESSLTRAFCRPEFLQAFWYCWSSRTWSGIRLITSSTRLLSENFPPQVLLNSAMMLESSCAQVE